MKRKYGFPEILEYLRDRKKGTLTMREHEMNEDLITIILDAQQDKDKVKTVKSEPGKTLFDY